MQYKNSVIKGIVIAVAMAGSSLAKADQTQASVPYTPSWQGRHYLQLLADDAGLPLTTSHWPLPAAAVQDALNAVQPANAEQAQALAYLQRALEQHLQTVQTSIQLRNGAEGIGGYRQNYTPRSSLSLASDQAQWTGESVSLAGCFGFKRPYDVSCGT